MDAVMTEKLRDLEHAFWDMADILADNLPEDDPDEDDPEVTGYVDECRERFENDKREFDQTMKEIRKMIEQKD